jgi:iron uptake system component EfeO
VATTPVPVPAAWFAEAEDSYRTYVLDHADALGELTHSFADAIRDGDDKRSRALYLQARDEWHRIRPAALAVSGLGPAVDAQQSDLGAQEEWTGWHRLEAELWPESGANPLPQDERERLADMLVADTDAIIADLAADTANFAPHVSAAFASQLVESALRTSLAGTAERYSGANLLAARAQIAGARVAIDASERIAQERDPGLTEVIYERLATVETLLDQHPGELDGLSADEALALIRATEALAEPLSRLASLVVDR